MMIFFSFHKDAFDKRDVMQNGSVRIGRTEVSYHKIVEYNNWIKQLHEIESS